METIEIIDSKQGYIKIAQKEPVNQWGVISGGVYRRLEFHDGCDGHTVTAKAVMAHTGAASDGVDVELGFWLTMDQVDALVTRLQQIQAAQDRRRQEKANSEMRQRMGLGD